MSYLPDHSAGGHPKSVGGEGIRPTLETHCFRGLPSTGLSYLPTISAKTLSQTSGLASECSLMRVWTDPEGI